SAWKNRVERIGRRPVFHRCIACQAARGRASSDTQRWVQYLYGRLVNREVEMVSAAGSNSLPIAQQCAPCCLDSGGFIREGTWRQQRLFSRKPPPAQTSTPGQSTGVA